MPLINGEFPRRSTKQIYLEENALFLTEKSAHIPG